MSRSIFPKTLSPFLGGSHLLTVLRVVAGSLQASKAPLPQTFPWNILPPIPWNLGLGNNLGVKSGTNCILSAPKPPKHPCHKPFQEISPCQWESQSMELEIRIEPIASNATHLIFFKHEFWSQGRGALANHSLESELVYHGT